ncbi:MAG: drug/metabolite exporter YedA [Labilithrix sp.]|nr:drug/metabolite exporter YedA [Labilithrix sp.]
MGASSLSWSRARGSSVDPRLVVALAVVWLVWGSTYLAMRVAVAALPPFLMAGARFVLAGGALLAYVKMRGGDLPNVRAWVFAAPIGALLFLIGNGFVVVAEQTLPSSVAAVVCATTPLVATGFAALRGERPRRVEVAGMALGFGGVVLLGVGSPLATGGGRGLLVVLAPLGWAAGSLLARAVGGGLGAAAAQMIAGGLWMLAVAAISGERLPAEIVWSSAAAWLYLVVFGSIVGFSAYSWLLCNARPAVAMSYAYVNPVIAVLLGAVLGGERLGWATLGATSLIASGVMVAVVLARRSASPPRRR